jgi:DNA-binding HxlR family transcriptional regulator
MVYSQVVTAKRSYEDACGAARALDLVGERWALLVVRELLLGPKRFTDLRAGLPGISPNVLSQRLDELERFAIVRRHRLAPPAGSWVYELSDWGRELEQVIITLGRWGARSPFMDHHAPISVDSVVLSLRTMFNPDEAKGVTGSYDVRFGEDRFHAEVDGVHFEINRGAAERPDAVIETDPATLASLIYDGRDLAEAEQSGDATVRGDRAALKRLFGLFTLPAPAPASCAEAS